ncbi:MAG: hypothetical protein DRG78_03320 [Epsilonproteobacteria bacterium]|nr:MAG: hypothetical protein DRG78_03320 [Campylobacterota bacterium]
MQWIIVKLINIKVKKMIKIDELIEDYNLHESLGKDIDFIFKLLLFTLKDFKRDYKIVFNMVTQNPLLWQKLALDTNKIFEKEDLLIAEYEPCTEYPFYRLYSYRYKEKSALSLEAFSSLLKREINVEDTKELYNKYNDPELTKNYINWEKNLNNQLASLSDISYGRINNTKIKQTIILHRQPLGCIVCGEKATGYISTILMNKDAILIIASTCDKHQELAKQNPCFLHFLSKLFQMGLDLSSMKMNEKIEKNLIELLISEIKRELNCELLKNIYNELKDEYVLTFKRISGVLIILRLHTFMDYGYMVNRPSGEAFQRIDSAPDHKEIKFFPDHLHRTITKNKKPNVESSYTFGFPILDLPSIIKMVNRLETELT